MTPVSSAFHLPERLAGKADPALIGEDEAHFAAIAEALENWAAELSHRLETTRATPARPGQEALDRDLEVHRLGARLRTLERYGIDLCLGRMRPADGTDPVYVGRLGLTDPDGTRLLVDWRSPAAEPFFAATHAHPMGLLGRRRYRWTLGRVSDYWDEVFTAAGLTSGAALDDQSAFIASLGSSRSARMRDVLGTIQADQDAIIRAPSHGTLVVDGGPGTGKTVVALHRAAYLLHSDPRLERDRGGVLVVGPHDPYLAYVDDVLPGLGEEGVATCTLRDLLPEGATAPEEDDPRVAALKGRVELVRAIEPAVALYEEPPTDPVVVDSPWGEVQVTATDWATAFAAPGPGVPHNEAREEIWAEIDEIAFAQVDEDAPMDEVRAFLRTEEDLRTTLERAWPMISATDLVGDLWSVPAYLRRCAPSLSVEEVRALQRSGPQEWTRSDLPLLDAARRRLGDASAAARARRLAAAEATEREQRSHVMDNLLAADDGEGLVTMLLGADLQDRLVETPGPSRDADRLAGPFAHVIVDEAQELTDAEWQMLLPRCPSRSFTVVGDRAQARHGFPESWTERLERVGLDRTTPMGLRVNYRTPREIMTEAEPVIRAAIPDANVPVSVRHGGMPVRYGLRSELHDLLEDWLDAHPEGTACVVTATPADLSAELGHQLGPERTRVLTPELVKGLEFDLVVLLDPDTWGDSIEGAVDRYVAMTRATRHLVILREAGPSA